MSEEDVNKKLYDQNLTYITDIIIICNIHYEKVGKYFKIAIFAFVL